MTLTAVPPPCVDTTRPCTWTTPTGRKCTRPAKVALTSLDVPEGVPASVGVAVHWHPDDVDTRFTYCATHAVSMFTALMNAMTGATVTP